MDRACDKRGCFIENGSDKETSVHNQKEAALILGTDNERCEELNIYRIKEEKQKEAIDDPPDMIE